MNNQGFSKCIFCCFTKVLYCYVYIYYYYVHVSIYVLTYRIVESKNPGFKEGDYVVANFGWRTHTVSNGEGVYKLDQKMFTELKLSTALGVLGMPGYVTIIIARRHHK